MNNKKFYIIIAVSIAVNLFFIGIFAGGYVNKHHKMSQMLFKEHFRGETMMMCPMCGDKMTEGHRHHYGEKKMDRMSHDTFPEKHHRKGMKRVFCGNVSEDVLNLEKEMLEKNKDNFKANFRAEMEIREALNAEFKKENLDMNVIKDLFTKQTEGFINIQKQAQDSLLEMITNLPYEKRSEVVCSKNKEDFRPMPLKKIDRQDFERHYGRPNEGKFHHR